MGRSLRSSHDCYFGIRLALEWQQTPNDRRDSTAARLDFYMANAIGIFAVSLFGAQRLTEQMLAKSPTGLVFIYACGSVIALFGFRQSRDVNT